MVPSGQLAGNLAGFAPGLPEALAGRAFKSRDFDEVRAHVGRMYCEHQMQLINRRSNLDLLTRRFECRGLTIAEVTYGADVLVTPGSLDQFYLIQVPSRGRAWVSVDGTQHPCMPGFASVQNPEKPIGMYWSADCQKTVLRYERASFERFAELYSGQPVRKALAMRPSVALDETAGLALRSMLDSLASVSKFAGDQLPPLFKAHLETCFMSALLMMQTPDGIDAFEHNDRRAAPLAVRKVRDYLEAHAHEPIDLADLCEISGVPLRTLHDQFRKHLGLTPLQLLREIRLERARADLLRAAPGTSVTSVALGWGFDHFGRFAASYRERFGETPRETLQRVRTH
ncbi:AraC family transcriptional regulator [Novosphingobium sp.]|uniref:AraC family transcriptional regulator n=1 Tax=Novosphingobium sp. TaxID=1874826 RepID=UPI0035B381E5